MLYYTILYYVILYYSVLCYIVLDCIILYYIILNHIYIYHIYIYISYIYIYNSLFYTLYIILCVIYYILYVTYYILYIVYYNIYIYISFYIILYCIIIYYIILYYIYIFMYVYAYDNIIQHPSLWDLGPPCLRPQGLLRPHSGLLRIFAPLGHGTAADGGSRSHRAEAAAGQLHCAAGSGDPKGTQRGPTGPTGIELRMGGTSFWGWLGVPGIPKWIQMADFLEQSLGSYFNKLAT